MEFAGVERADSEEDANVGREGVGVVHCFIRVDSSEYFYYGSFLELVWPAGRVHHLMVQSSTVLSVCSSGSVVGAWVIFKYWYPGIF